MSFLSPPGRYRRVTQLCSKELPSRRFFGARLVGLLGTGLFEPSLRWLLLGYPPTKNAWSCNR